MKLVYKLQQGETQIFSPDFVNENKKSIKIIINNKLKALEGKVSFHKKGELTIKLLGLKNSYNLSSMFKGCKSLLKIEFLSKYNKRKTKEKYIDELLSKNIIILKGNNSFKKYIIYQSFMFRGNICSFSLLKICDWNTISVKHLKNMFNGCSSLKSLPDISKWNVINVTDMSYLLNGCSSLISLPDISKWNVINVKNMDFLFMDVHH